MAEEGNTKLYRRLPQVGELLEGDRFRAAEARFGRELVAEALRTELAGLREGIRSGSLEEASLAEAVAGLPTSVEQVLAERLRPSLRPVINATGVILQTNLGRAPLSAEAIEAMVAVARGYCNVEMDLEAGERSRRDVHAEGLILEVLRGRGAFAETPGRGAAVVNNCAAATFLALNTLAEGGEVIVSRGELVEIGGGFRVPDILRKSGAVLREVGTTNRTRASDYAEAITPATRLILRVHRSNFRIEGFTEQPSLAELVALGARSRVPVFDDQGTGCAVDLAAYGIPGESSWVESVAGGAALVAASGDKLLGGPQCGLLVGSEEIVGRIRRNPLFRALRVDKLTYAALGATLRAYLCGREETLPALAMLRLSAESVRLRCEGIVAQIVEQTAEQSAAGLAGSAYTAEVVPVESLVGGGTTPGAALPSFAVALGHGGMSEETLAARLREGDPAVVTRTHAGRVLLDLRTVFPAQDALLLAALRGVGGASVTDAKERARGTASR